MDTYTAGKCPDIFKHIQCLEAYRLKCCLKQWSLIKNIKWFQMSTPKQEATVTPPASPPPPDIKVNSYTSETDMPCFVEMLIKVIKMSRTAGCSVNWSQLEIQTVPTIFGVIEYQAPSVGDTMH